MPSVVLTDRLTKDFSAGFWRPRRRRALDGVSLDVAPGEIFGLLGPNGAGKTTTIKLLLQLLWPTSGRVELFGRPAGDRAARARLGFLPEQPTFYDHLTAAELVAYFAGVHGMRGAARRRRAAEVLDLVGLGAADRARPLRQFSKGMLQRVGLAQALVNSPELVILDEPMSGLDPGGRRDVRDLILRLRDEGRTILFSSHILSDAEALCSRVAILAGGRIVVGGTLSELTAAGARGWEIAASDVPAAFAAALARDGASVREIAPGRYTIGLAPEVRPEPVIADLARAGAALVSATPIRQSLEDVFLQSVRQAEEAVGERLGA